MLLGGSGCLYICTVLDVNNVFFFFKKEIKVLIIILSKKMEFFYDEILIKTSNVIIITCDNAKNHQSGHSSNSVFLMGF